MEYKRCWIDTITYKQGEDPKADKTREVGSWNTKRALLHRAEIQKPRDQGNPRTSHSWQKLKQRAEKAKRKSMKKKQGEQKPETCQDGDTGGEHRVTSRTWRKMEWRYRRTQTNMEEDRRRRNKLMETWGRAKTTNKHTKGMKRKSRWGKEQKNTGRREKHAGGTEKHDRTHKGKISK